jgi:hypothetical protein
VSEYVVGSGGPGAVADDPPHAASMTENKIHKKALAAIGMSLRFTARLPTGAMVTNTTMAKRVGTIPLTRGNWFGPVPAEFETRFEPAEVATVT